MTDAGPLQEALGYALEMHGDQVRKGTEILYVAHLLAVAASAEASAVGDDFIDGVPILFVRVRSPLPRVAVWPPAR